MWMRMLVAIASPFPLSSQALLCLEEPKWIWAQLVFQARSLMGNLIIPPKNLSKSLQYKNHRLPILSLNLQFRVRTFSRAVRKTCFKRDAESLTVDKVPKGYSLDRFFMYLLRKKRKSGKSGRKISKLSSWEPSKRLALPRTHRSSLRASLTS
jgi:hypothetical protein